MLHKSNTEKMSSIQSIEQIIEKETFCIAQQRFIVNCAMTRNLQIVYSYTKRPYTETKRSTQVQYNCNTSFFTTAAISLQVVENLYCSAVLQVSAQVQYNCNTRKKFLYCSCIVVVLRLCRPLKGNTVYNLRSRKTTVIPDNMHRDLDGPVFLLVPDALT